MGMVKNLSSLERGIGVMMRRVEESYVAEYRQFVWAVFVRLLYETPQYSGEAVASWNIVLSDGVGPGAGPTGYKSDVEHGMPRLEALSVIRGTGVDLSVSQLAESPNAREKGDMRAIDYARRRNAKKIPLIKRRTRVFFVNTARGDNNAKIDKDKGLPEQFFYLQALQEPGYWVAKLREVNKPYETIDETMTLMQARLFKAARNDGGKFGYGGWERWV